MDLATRISFCGQCPVQSICWPHLLLNSFQQVGCVFQLMQQTRPYLSDHVVHPASRTVLQCQFSQSIDLLVLILSMSDRVAEFGEARGVPPPVHHTQQRQKDLSRQHASKS